MNEGEIQRLCNYPILPKNSKTCSHKRFVNIDDGSMGGNHWTAFYIRDNKSYYFDSFSGQPVKFLLTQIP